MESRPSRGYAGRLINGTLFVELVPDSVCPPCVWDFISMATCFKFGGGALAVGINVFLGCVSMNGVSMV